MDVLRKVFDAIFHDDGAPSIFSGLILGAFRG